MTHAATIRGAVADGDDGERISRLAELAGGPAPEGLVLLAEVNGDPVAAIGVFDGRAISDPDRSSSWLRMRLLLLRLELRLVVSVRGM